MTARPEGCGVVPVSTNQRQMDSRIYSPAQCVGQLAENAAAKGSRFNATEFNVAILSQFETSTRAKETDVGLPSSTLALKVLDNGVGFLYEEVEDMLTYGTPDKVTTEKKFGKVWHTLAAIGSNFDKDGFYNLRRLSWPHEFTGSTVAELAAKDFFGHGSIEAYEHLFRTDGKTWATLKTLNIAHKYFKEIKDTGVLAIFPFGLEANAIKADVQADDIEMQGVSLSNLLSKYFLPRQLGLLPAEYWAEFRGFEIKLHVANKKTKSLWPVVPPFSMSPPISIIIGDAEHTIIYGPYQSEKYTGPFPYKHTAGLEFYNQNYQTFLTSRSRIMNPLYAPKLSDSGNTRVDYFSKQKSASQKGANTLMQQLLDTLCGMKLTHAETPEAYTELRELLDKHQIFDAKNPHLKIEEYVKQLKNLKWLLGLPFEIYAKVDTDALEFNDAKDDLKDDALKRDSFFANVHATIALDVLKRMLPGFDKVVKEAHQKAKAAAKAEAAANAAAKTAAAANGTTPAANKAVGSSSKAAASTGKKAASAKKGTASAKRAPKAAQTAAETSPPDAAEMAIELGKALAQAASGAAAIPGTESKEAQQQAAAVSREQRYQARQAATAPQAQPAQGQGQGPDQGQGKGQNGQPRNGQSSDLHSLGSQGTDRATPPWESLPAGQQGAKRRKLSPGLMQSLTNGSNGSSADAQGLNMLAKAAAQGTSSQATSPSQQTWSQQTRSQLPNIRPTLTLETETVPDSNDMFHDADSAGVRVSRQDFESLWVRAMARGDIKDSQWTQDLKAMALMWAPDSL